MLACTQRECWHLEVPSSAGTQRRHTHVHAIHRNRNVLHRPSVDAVRYPATHKQGLCLGHCRVPTLIPGRGYETDLSATWVWQEESMVSWINDVYGQQQQGNYGIAEEPGSHSVDLHGTPCPPARGRVNGLPIPHNEWPSGSRR